MSNHRRHEDIIHIQGLNYDPGIQLSENERKNIYSDILQHISPNRNHRENEDREYEELPKTHRENVYEEIPKNHRENIYEEIPKNHRPTYTNTDLNTYNNFNDIKYLELNLKVQFNDKTENEFVKYEDNRITVGRNEDSGRNAKAIEDNLSNDIEDENSIEDSKAEEFTLGYSNNPFGSRSQYLENVNKTLSRYPNSTALNITLPSTRVKRSVLNLYNQVLCATGCDPLSYKGYGCYCGFLGSGYVVDGIDRCCKMHDWCYNTAGCPMFLEYFVPYLWKCYRRRPLCAIDHGSYGGQSSCAERLCQCDRALAECLRDYPCPSTKAICTSSPWRLFQNIFML